MAFSSLMLTLLSWLPPNLRVICLGVIVIFVLVTLLKIVGLILDALPFL